MADLGPTELIIVVIIVGIVAGVFALLRGRGRN